MAAALARIEKLGGKVEYGPDKTVVAVDLNPRATTNADILLLTALKDVVKLDLYGAEISDAGIPALARFPKLRELGLENTDITDAGVKELSKLRRDPRAEPSPDGPHDRRGHGLPGPNAEAGEPQAPLQQDRRRRHRQAGRDEATAGHRRPRLEDHRRRAGGPVAAAQLKDLKVRSASVTDEGMKALAGMAKLKILAIEDSVVTDAGLAALKGKDMEQMDLLRCNAVTDDGLANFAGMTHLKRLDSPRHLDHRLGPRPSQGRQGAEAVGSQRNQHRR